MQTSFSFHILPQMPQITNCEMSVYYVDELRKSIQTNNQFNQSVYYDVVVNKKEFRGDLNNFGN